MCYCAYMALIYTIFKLCYRSTRFGSPAYSACSTDSSFAEQALADTSALLDRDPSAEHLPYRLYKMAGEYWKLVYYIPLSHLSPPTGDLTSHPGAQNFFTPFQQNTALLKYLPVPSWLSCLNNDKNVNTRFINKINPVRSQILCTKCRA